MPKSNILILLDRKGINYLLLEENSGFWAIPFKSNWKSKLIGETPSIRLKRKAIFIEKRKINFSITDSFQKIDGKEFLYIGILLTPLRQDYKIMISGFLKAKKIKLNFQE